MERPTSVTVIGWIWIVLGILMFLSAGMGLLAFVAQRAMIADMPSPPEELPGMHGVIWRLFQYFHIFAAVQILLAALIIVAGIHFLKLRAWARTCLEVVSWLGLTYVLGFGAFWLFMWVSMSTQIGEIPEPFPGDAFAWVGVMMGIVVITTSAVPLIVVIKFLRGATIRNAVRGNTEQPDVSQP